MAIFAHALFHLHDSLDDLDTGRFQQCLSLDRRRPRGPDARASYTRHSLFAARPSRSVDGGDRGRIAVRVASRVLYDEAFGEMKPPSLRAVSAEAKLLLIGIPLLIWTLLPIYNLFLFAISPKESAFAGKLWPDHPTLHNFAVVFKQEHYYLQHFWQQLLNSLVIAVATRSEEHTSELQSLRHLVCRL